MNHLINQLIDVDKQARRRVANAKKERAGVVDSLDSTKKALREKNEAQFSAFVAQETARCDAVLKEARASQAALDQARIARMDDVANAHRDGWVDDIVKGVLN